jgi:hypothetical protein
MFLDFENFLETGACEQFITNSDLGFISPDTSSKLERCRKSTLDLCFLVIHF